MKENRGPGPLRECISQKIPERLMKYKIILQQIGLILVIFCIGTAMDWVVHHANAEFYVPFLYYRNKIIFGTILGFAVLKIVSRWTTNYRWQAFWMSLIVAILLQTKYFILGYELFFVFLFIPIHFLVFLIPSSVIFKKFRSIF